MDQLNGVNVSQDCLSYAGPTDGSIDSCLGVDLTTCGAYIGEECSYTGDRLTECEPPAGDLDSIASCQAWAAPLVAAGVNHFHFYAPLHYALTGGWVQNFKPS